jgi:hypothetical protein
MEEPSASGIPALRKKYSVCRAAKSECQDGNAKRCAGKSMKRKLLFRRKCRDYLKSRDSDVIIRTTGCNEGELTEMRSIFLKYFIFYPFLFLRL